MNIRDDAFEQLVDRLRPQVVFYLAAQADVGTSVERPAVDAEVNVVGRAEMTLATGLADT